MHKMVAAASIAMALLVSCRREATAPVAPPTATASQEPAELRPPVATASSATASVAPSQSPAETPAAAASPGSAILAATYPPRDACAKLPGFASFRDKLFAAARARDVDAFAALADPAVHLDFGGGAGLDELKKRLAARDAPLWSEIDALAGLGCAADKGVATLPWIFARVPERADPYKTMLVTGSHVPLRAKAAASAPAKAELDWALVTLAGASFDPKARFAEVVAPGGARGFVETVKLRSILDYRLIADRSGGEWKITALIAGD